MVDDNRTLIVRSDSSRWANTDWNFYGNYTVVIVDFIDTWSNLMPFALLIVGVVLLISAARGTHTLLFSTLESEFSGQGNFVFWMVSILLIGSIGYIPKVKPISDALIVLVILTMVLTKGKSGLFQKAQAAINLTNTAAPTTSAINTALVATGATGQSGSVNLASGPISGSGLTTGVNLFAPISNMIQ